MNSIHTCWFYTNLLLFSGCKIQVTFPQVRGQVTMIIQINERSKSVSSEALLDRGEYVWFGNLSMEQWPVLLKCDRNLDHDMICDLLKIKRNL